MTAKGWTWVVVPVLCAGVAAATQDGDETRPAPPAVVALAQRVGDAWVEAAPAPKFPHRAWDLAADAGPWGAIAEDAAAFVTAVEPERIDGGLRLPLTGGRSRFRVGGIEARFEGLRRGDWVALELVARTSDRTAGVAAVANLGTGGELPGMQIFFMADGSAPPLFNDGSTQTYRLPLLADDGDPDAALERVTLLVAAPGAAVVDVLALRLVPAGAEFATASGRRAVDRGGELRDALFAHAPATLAFEVDLGPASGPDARLDVALAVEPGAPVTFSAALEVDGEERPLFAERIADADAWHQRSIALAGARGVGNLILRAAAEDEAEGAVALWGAPVLSRPSADERRPNVIFYVIDGGDADLMSLYEYGRPTTPFLEQLADEAVVFTRAHSNSTWTQPSTVSFLTGLHHSVLGGLRRGLHSTAVPPAATTLAEHFRAGGWQTAFFTANPNAGRIIGADRGHDVAYDGETEHHSTSSHELHARYRAWRDAYPGRPAFAHLQTTDVHEPNEPVAPFAGRFIDEEAKRELERQERRLWTRAGQNFGSTGIVEFYDEALAAIGADRAAYYGARRDLYDETMAYQDRSLEGLVAELKARGEWEHTLLVIAADHGHPAGTFARFGRGLIDPRPAPWQGALCDAYATRVPLVFVWPGVLEGGRRVDVPVSMIDVLPTLLELVGLPAPEVCQGASLVPLLRGEETERGPVVLDEFRVDEATGLLVGNLELIDGRFGASLEIGPGPDGEVPATGRHSVPAGGRWGAVQPFYPDVPRLLLYDLATDPFAARAVNDAHPELVERYRAQLEELWTAQRLLARRFEAQAETTPLSADQLEQLRRLGYIR